MVPNCNVLAGCKVVIARDAFHSIPFHSMARGRKKLSVAGLKSANAFFHRSIDPLERMSGHGVWIPEEDR